MSVNEALQEPLDTSSARKYDPDKDISFLCAESRKYNNIDPSEYKRYRVKRGLRNDDGSGVVAGITRICNVHGYVMDEGEKSPVEGRITYRGVNLMDIIAACRAEDRFGYEEVAWLLLYGQLPTRHQLDIFDRSLSNQRELPPQFVDDVIMKAPSANIMNALQRATLALYTYDEDPDGMSMENVMRQSMSLIAKMPSMMVAAYQVKRRNFDHKSMYFHNPDKKLTVAENILRTMRSDKQFTDQEAKMLDLCLMLHVEHGGGNNSTFATRVLTSSATDTYSAISAGIGSLKGPRHGGANAKVLEMMGHIKENVSNWQDETEVARFLRKLMDKTAGDGSGLIYGMGHAVYTLSDPRAIMLKSCAESMVVGTEYEAEYNLIQLVEKLTPDIFREKKGIDGPLCANVDLYSGMVYTMLKIPPELMTPMFAVARTVGWCAHRIEEIFTTGGKIMRPAYKAISPRTDYVPLDKR
ncbi:citrate synthase [Ruminococcaceae bacterium OttesenSCG-928-L11]|nr:citrate synthase [Ruminococcaceae bacterium OttesenSCG-928-L11]